MPPPRLVIVLTIVNLALLVCSLAQLRPVVAQEVAPILRGRALEIVDARGRVRASLQVYPADPTVKLPDGSTGYPETVLLRLVTSQGRPTIKIAATEDGSAIGLGGESDRTDIVLRARGTTTVLQLTNQDGQERVIKP